jgi:GT2 family glycosyltransferase
MPRDQIPLTAVIITHNRRDEVCRALGKLREFSGDVPAIVVDNGSTDGTAEQIREQFPAVEVLATGTNLGAAARNLGVERARSRYVALCDDDTWWAEGCLARGVELMNAFPRVAIATARLLNGPEETEDPICRALAASPLSFPGPLPGKPLLGFLAGASIVRRRAFLEAGGFHRRFFIGGEEELLAIDLAMRGWALCYVPELVVHHYPSPRRDAPRRNYHVVRNRLWVSWLRRPAARARVQTWMTVRTAFTDRTAARGLVGALAGLPWIMKERRVVPPALERQLALLESDRIVLNAEAPATTRVG